MLSLSGAPIKLLRAIAIAAMLSEVVVAQTADTQSTSELQEIVVTAQFRKERLQDTPLAVSAVNAAMMEARNQNTMQDVAARTPSITIEKSANGGGITPELTIRGIGQTDFFPSIEPGVGIYIDDIYYGLMVGAEFEILDLDRVEILRGPQGTLAGKNSEGGSIKLFTKAPTNDLDGNVKLTYGSYNLVEAKGALNLPVIDDKLLLRVSGLVRRQDGWFKRLDYGCVHPGTLPTLSGNGVGNCVLGAGGGQDLSAIRVNALMKWTDAFRQTVSVDTIRDTEDISPAVLTSQGPWATGYNFITPPGSNTNYEALVGNAFTTSQFDFPNKNFANQWGASNVFDVDLPLNLAIKSISAYRRTDAEMVSDGSLSPFNTYTQLYEIGYRQFTQELRLSGSYEKLLDWTLGAYYLDNKTYFPGRLLLNGGFAPGGGGLDLDFLDDDFIRSGTKAGFGNMTMHATDRFNITAGVRYTSEHKDYTFGRLNPNGGTVDPREADINGVTRSYRGHNIDYRVALDYRWNDNLMTYAQVSTGFKAGGVNPRAFFASQAIPFQPEKVRSYEVGFKSDLLNRRLRFNADGYVSDYTEMQLIVTSCDDISYITLPGGTKVFIPGAPCTATRNAGDSRIWGVEADSEYEPLDGLLIDASASYINFKYRSVDPATGIPLTAGLPFLAKQKFAVGAQYAIRTDWGTITPRLDYDYRSDFETEVAPYNPDYGHVSGRGLLGGRIAYQTKDKIWEADLSGTNLTNKFYYANKFDRSTAPFFNAQATPAAPRMWMLSVKRNF